LKEFFLHHNLEHTKNNQEKQAIKGLNTIKAKLKDNGVETKRKEYPAIDNQEIKGN